MNNDGKQIGTKKEIFKKERNVREKLVDVIIQQWLHIINDRSQ